MKHWQWAKRNGLLSEPADIDLIERIERYETRRGIVLP
jgi:hypothetical protein